MSHAVKQSRVPALPLFGSRRGAEVSEEAEAWLRSREKAVVTKKAARVLEEDPWNADAADDPWAEALRRFESGDDEAAVVVLRRILEKRPGDAPAHALLGQILMAKGDAEAVVHLARAMDGDPETALSVSQTVYRHLRQSGRAAAAGVCARRAAKAGARLRRGEAACAAVAPEDPLAPHNLSADVVEKVAGQVRSREDAAEAYLVRRPVEDAESCYILALVPRRRSARRAEQLRDAIAAEAPLPPRTFVLALGKGADALREALRAVPDSALLHRPAR